MISTTVMYKVTDDVALPAIVVKVWPTKKDEPTIVNLQVFQNGDGGLQFVQSVEVVNEDDEGENVCYVPA